MSQNCELENGQKIQLPIYRKFQTGHSCFYVKVDKIKGELRQVNIGIGFGDPDDRRYEYKKHILNYPPISFYNGTGDCEICDEKEFQGALEIILGSIEI
jgi:hypothetical protein